MESSSIDSVCKELVEMVTDYLNHTLPAADRERFDKHLLTCPPCTSYLAQMRATVEIAGELGHATAAGDVEEELVSLFRRWHRRL